MISSLKELIYDFFIHPMRLFFIMSGLFAIFGTIILIFNIGDFISFHKFIFIELFVSSAFVGFLLTAVSDWADYKGSLLPYSVIGFILLILALSTQILGFNGSIFIAFLWSFIAITTLIWLIKAKNYDNFSLIFLLCFIAFIEFYGVIYEPKPYALIHCFMGGIILIGFRISTVLARLALDRKFKDNSYIFIPNPILKNISYISLLALALCDILRLDNTTSGFICAGAGLIILSQISQWHHRVFLSTHYTFIYYILLFGSGLIYLALGVDLLFGLNFTSTILHGITIWSTIGFIFFVFNVSSLRHSGQATLNLPICGKIGIILLAIATISKLFLAQIWDIFYITIPAILVGLLFLIFVGRYTIIYKNNPFTDDPE
ncbi:MULTISPECIES: NnrS family protein [Campylobacter]|uniref:NnrS family protein n=1 Tax=Campylobacter porcelli TaxID=1660073 RepID=A0A1X9SUZ8_9BACT|nr:MULTISPECIES: NnrS family protein [unclassified Campylobacter]MCR8678835.1 NnrS family protein [Campylobacter sp. RM19072]MCR8695968.1 NnrS family protein [Campylobacter sp. RM19073]MEE3704864.1 NnrS family protein [Campylobacter sp. CX2-8023-23]MEE3744142.1 NnrS family protein [Campylobacter sp. CX2-4855-23]MEE3776887.1 NnrS family protein [Campylobacter sp. CX2-4080-23]